MTEGQRLLQKAIRASGLSARRFAEEVVTRDERTVRRWIAGDIEIPAVVVRALGRYIKLRAELAATLADPFFTGKRGK